MSPLAELKTILAEVNDLRSARSVLHWDQATYMPPGGAPAHARQMATLTRLAHNIFTAPRVGDLLEKLEACELGDYDSDDASLVRVTRRHWNHATRIPVEFKVRLAIHGSRTYIAWTHARPQNDFATLRPLLEETLELSREYAGFFPHEHPADPLMDSGGINRELSDEGFTVGTLRPLFAELRRQLMPLVEVACAGPVADVSCLQSHYPEGGQAAFTRTVLNAIGFDWQRGRLDRTHHPFMTKFSTGDVRITNCCDEDNLRRYFFSALHEAGHALYEQGIARNLEATPLANGTSSGLHESQSRLWENQVGRSLGFWRHYYPQLGEHFPQFKSVPLEIFWRAINRVQKSVLRIGSDELTYDLHIMIRFELELQMLEGTLAIKDLPDAWREAYRATLGVCSDTDRNGCLQDVHWFSGTIGGQFQGYTLGNILSAQFFAKAGEERPGISAEIERGDFTLLRGWLTDKIYRHGAKFPSAELIRRAAGEDLNIGPYVSYLREKYIA